MAKASLDQLLAMGRELREYVHQLLEGDTVLIYPSHPMTAPRLVFVNIICIMNVPELFLSFSIKLLTVLSK